MIFSNTEFYFTKRENITENLISIFDEEAKHISSVMRHKINDEIFVTNGTGNVYKSKIIEIKKSEIKLSVIANFNIEKKYENVVFYIPILKSTERFEFALEKCVELGIINFKIFSSVKSHKRGIKIDRWEKILISAMKQSLQSHLPKMEFVKIISKDLENSVNIIFDQNAEYKFTSYLNNYKNEENRNKIINLFFGPEAGLTQADIDKIPNPIFVKMNKNRLRSETAIISAASILTNNL
ncbi:MAG: 16S rRNA (uracil(1498)-N(3))-methyltransferase [Ignavibacteriae bacterium]|nr:16S rRNA (uracil(1498)-N(3))-methyltransferase [Ignavibacteriota bacterium]